ncbi:MAG: ChaN family lipoprotein [Gammaproteobacteria bacterium]|nr:ChaN family lipoprotein [Gammaproteobacteria bacterium]
MKKIFGLIVVSCTLLFNLSACQNKSPDTSSSQQHPLLDKVWSISEQNFVSVETLNQRILDSKIILLGETHDNIKHHELQAKVIAHLSTNKLKSSIAYEMLNQSQQSIIDTFQEKYYSQTSTSSMTPIPDQVDAFAKTINWEKTGWPEWKYYRSVFYNTIESKLPIIAANLDIKTIRKVIKEGSGILDQHYQELLLKYQYDESLKKELEKEILSSHCDMLPEKMLSPMLLGQQVRDLAMMQAILNSLSEKESSDKTVLIAGSGHTRTDYGIPYYLHQEQPKLKSLSLAFIEVEEDEFNPKEYAKGWSDTAQQLPFDYVWFTEKAEREDQCEKMRAYMKKKKTKTK